MSALDFEWALELRRTDDTHLTQVRISPRWGPAREWIRLLAARRGVIPLGTAARVAEAEPRWHPTRGAPFASGFRARLEKEAPDVLQKRVELVEGGEQRQQSVANALRAITAVPDEGSTAPMTHASRWLPRTM